MGTKRMRAALAALVLAAGAGAAQEAAAASGGWAAALADFLRAAREAYGLPALAAALVEDGKVTAYAADGEARPGVPATPDTPFLLGSTTKSVTAAAALVLAARGGLDLDAPVSDYLPGLGYRRGELTVRHLLNQTSGLSDGRMRGDALGGGSFEAEIARVSAAADGPRPGEAYEYCNSNYRLAGAVVAAASGESFEAFVGGAVLGPAGMRTAAFGPEAAGKWLARGHGRFFGFPLPRTQPPRAAAAPSGYLAASARDCGSFLAALVSSARGEGPFPAEAVRAAWKPPEGIGSKYGMGWLLADEGGRSAVVHGGSLENYQSFFYLEPETGSGFVLLCNQGGIVPMMEGFPAARDGLIAIMAGKDPAPLPPPRAPLFLALFAAAVGAVSALRWFLFARKRNPERPRGSLSRAAAAVGTAWDLAAAPFLAFGFVPLMNALMGDSADWPTVAAMLPELPFVFGLAAASAAVRGIAKLVRIRRTARD